MSVKVYVWLPTGGKVGHSSMQVGDRANVSLWPGHGRKSFVRSAIQNDSCKYSRTYKILLDRFGDRLPSETITPTAPSVELLQTIHPPKYLQQLTHSRQIAEALELASLAWVPSGILDRHVLHTLNDLFLAVRHNRSKTLIPSS